jgi:hypothetical protein
MSKQLYRNNVIPVEELQKIFKYSDGSLYLKYREDRNEKWNLKFANTKVKTSKYNGYNRLHVCYEGTNYNLREHVLIWAILKNKYPDMCIDHINTIRSDNRIENLQEVDYYQNNIRRAAIKGGTSQYKGVASIDAKCWRVTIYKKDVVLKKNKRQFDKVVKDEIEAAILYNEMVVKIHPSEYCYFNDISMGYTNKEYPNMPRGWKPEEVAA